MSDDTLLTRDEVANLLGDTIRSIATHRANGMPYVRLGPKKFRYRRADVQAWIDDQTISRNY
jgi:excisionase family DNA binding protein